MKKFFLASVISFFLFAPSSRAGFPPRPAGTVTDQARVIDADARGRIESLLDELKRKTSAEVAVVTVSSLDGLDVNDYAAQLFKSWGIGVKGKDNGVLFLVAPNERKVRIEVGYGLEPILPDGYVGRILHEKVLPFFRQGRTSDGISSGTDAIAQSIANSVGARLDGSIPVKPAHQPENNWNTLFTLLFIAFVILIIFSSRRSRGIWWGGGGWYGGGWSGGGFGGGNFGGGGFGGFGGGSSGGGGASGSW